MFKKILLSVLVLVSILSTVAITQASSLDLDQLIPYTVPSEKTINPVDPSFITGDIVTETSAEEAITNFINYILMFLGVICLIIVIYAGYIWITAFGDDGQITKAKNILTGVVVGIIIISASYAIVVQIISSRYFSPIFNV